MLENQLAYESLDEEQYKRLNEDLAGKDTMEVIKWAYQQFGDKLVYACSFGAEAMVLIDMISKVRKDARIVFLDTHLHFQETYDLIEKVKVKYPSLKLDMIEPELSLEQQAQEYGEQLWKRNPDQCCHIRKIQPLAKALKGSKAWLSGLRRDQSPTRARTEFVNPDRKFQSIKICPLIHWTWQDVWQYIKYFNLPYNELHDRGYPSIGCEMCTLPSEEGGDSRSGRWASFGKTECGLHQ